MRKEGPIFSKILCLLGILSIALARDNPVSASDGPSTIVFPDGAVFSLLESELCPGEIPTETPIAVRCQVLQGSAREETHDVIAAHNMHYRAPGSPGWPNRNDAGGHFLMYTNRCILIEDESYWVGWPIAGVPIYPAWTAEEYAYPRVITTQDDKGRKGAEDLLTGLVYVIPIEPGCQFEFDTPTPQPDRRLEKKALRIDQDQ